MIPQRAMSDTESQHSVYEGVQRLPPGSMFSIELPGTAPAIQRYWNWLDRQVDPGTDRFDEIAGRYGELLRQAVRERLCGTTAAHLSGGMDSTSVALLARDILAAEPGAGSLHSLSLVYDALSYLAREKPYLESVLGQPRGMTVHRLAGDECLDFDFFQRVGLHDEPCPWLDSLATEEALAKEAARAGANSLLTGYGADGMLCMFPYHLTELLRRGRLLAAWREACGWAATGNSSPWKILVPFGLENLLPAWGRAGIGSLLRGGYASAKNPNKWAIAPWVEPGFARRYGLRDRALANIRRIYSSCRPVGLSVALYSITDTLNDFSRWYLSAPRGIHLGHPFLDPRVLCFSLGMQVRVRREPGSQKPVLAAALRGVLPDQISNRPRKGNFNEVYVRGLARNLTALETLVQEAPIDGLGLLDKKALLDSLQRAALGTARDMTNLNHMNSTLALLKWLTLEGQRPPAAQPLGTTIPTE